MTHARGLSLLEGGLHDWKGFLIFLTVDPCPGASGPSELPEQQTPEAHPCRQHWSWSVPIPIKALALESALTWEASLGAPVRHPGKAENPAGEGPSTLLFSLENEVSIKLVSYPGREAPSDPPPPPWATPRGLQL